MIKINEIPLADRIVEKKWGREIIIHNDEDYCGKILVFDKDARFSMHYHMKKRETWYVQDGLFRLRYINTENAEIHEVEIGAGEVIDIEPGLPHQLIALTKGEIFEISTQHFDDDSYRVGKGDSQK